MRKSICEDFPSLGIRFIKDSGYLDTDYKKGRIIWTHSGLEPSRAVQIMSRSQNDAPLLYLSHVSEYALGLPDTTDYYAVRLTSHACFFGGKRYWFVCPLIRNGIPCKRRVGVLYAMGVYFGCRGCYGLVYRSQQYTHTGWRGFFGRTVFSDLFDQESALRVKYWRGKPTKRYRSLLRKISLVRDIHKS